MSSVVVLDTTVLIYAAGTEHPLREPCREIVAAVADGSLDATTTPEVIGEFTHVRARRRGRGSAADLAREYAELLAPLITVGAAELAQGLALFAQASALGCFDAVLAATALGRGAAALVSADRAFGEVTGLRHELPTPGIVDRLRG